MKELDNFYMGLTEPNQSCMLALKEIILDLNADITPMWKYKLPFFYYKGKMFCYLWMDKKTTAPYIGIVKGNKLNHDLLEQGNRKMMKILRVNPNQDIPIKTIQLILREALELY